MSRICLLAMLAGALLEAGCGQPDEEQQVRAALDRFATAVEKRDYKTLCTKSLASTLLAPMKRIALPCEVALSQGAFGAASKPKLTVAKVRIVEKGKRAAAEVTTTAEGQEPSKDVVELVKEDGTWKIADLAGTGPPAPSPTAFAP